MPKVPAPLKRLIQSAIPDVSAPQNHHPLIEFLEGITTGGTVAPAAPSKRTRYLSVTLPSIAFIPAGETSHIYTPGQQAGYVPVQLIVNPGDVVSLVGFHYGSFWGVVVSDDNDDGSAVLYPSATDFYTNPTYITTGNKAAGQPVPFSVSIYNETSTPQTVYGTASNTPVVLEFEIKPA